MSMAHIRHHYGVPAKRGLRIRVNGREARITGSDGARLRVRLDGAPRPALIHPTWRVTYPGWSRRDQVSTRRIETVELPGVSVDRAPGPVRLHRFICNPLNR